MSSLEKTDLARRGNSFQDTMGGAEKGLSPPLDGLELPTLQFPPCPHCLPDIGAKLLFILILQEFLFVSFHDSIKKEVVMI